FEERAGWALAATPDGPFEYAGGPIGSPHARHGLRYVDAVALAGGDYRLYYESARPDGAHELRTEVVSGTVGGRPADPWSDRSGEDSKRRPQCELRDDREADLAAVDVGERRPVVVRRDLGGSGDGLELVSVHVAERWVEETAEDRPFDRPVLIESCERD